METRGTMKEYIRVLTRVRPPINNNDDINQVQPGSGEEGSTPNRLSTTVVDDQVVKLAPVKIEKLRFGLSRALQTYGDANEKLDKVFKFDRVFAEQASQDDVFDLVQDTIDQVMDGYTTTLISYGPTFGGKSFTMVGTEKDPGVIPRAIEKIFKLLSERKANNADKKDVVIEVEVSYVELHNKTFRNLLKSEAPPSTPAAKANSVAASSTAMPNLPALDVSETDEVLNPFTVRDENRIDIHETPALGVFLVGSGLRVPVSTAEDTFNLLRKGESNRLSRAAISTDGSTRSHAIITLYVESKVPFVTPPPSEEEGVEEDHSNIAGHLLMGKLHLVDLAGGERVDVSKPQGEDLAKAQYINKSLLAFGEVLHTLAASAVMNKKKSKLSLVSVSTDTIPPVSTPVKTSSDLHVPYLDNRLTHFLKDSLGGYARTVLLTCIGPEGENYYVNLHCLQYASKALKVANLVAPIRIDIPASIELDPTSELSIINQLKIKLFEPPKSAIKKSRRSLFTSPTPKKSSGVGAALTLVVHQLTAEDLPYICFPFQPWIQAEVGSVIHRTPKHIYMGNFVKYPDDMTFELTTYDLEGGIDVDFRVFVKAPFRRRREIGRARLEIKSAFPMLEERNTIEAPLFHLNANNEVLSAGRLVIDGTLRPSNMTKFGVFDPKIYSTKKSFISPPRPSEMIKAPETMDMDERVLLTIKKATTPDIVILIDVDPEDKPTPYSFALEAKCLSSADAGKKTPFMNGKVRFRNRELVGNLSFDDPDVDFEMTRDEMVNEELHILVYSKNSDQSYSRAVGRAIFPLQSLALKTLDEMKLTEISAVIKDVTGIVCGKMFINITLSTSGRNRQAEAMLMTAIPEELSHLPRDMEYAWVKINSVEALGLNSLKLLGRSVRYSHLEDSPMFDALTKQDLLLVMEYGNKWVSHSPVLTDQDDCCEWNELDFRFLVHRDNFLHDSIRISVFNRKLHGKEGLLGSAILALQQFVIDPSLSIAHIPVKLRSIKNKVNGTLHINGIVIKDGGGEWIPGVVEKVHNDGRYDVRYDDGELEERIGKDFLRLVPQGEVVTTAVKVSSIKTPHKAVKYPSGTKVEVKVGNQDVWLPAVVVGIRGDGSYEIQSDFELPNNNVMESELRPLAMDTHKGMKRSASKGCQRFLYSVGDKVEGNFKAKGKWYKAKVWKTYHQDGVPHYDLDYSSGEREIGVTDDRIRLYQQVLAPSSSFLVTPQKSIFDVEPEEEPLDLEELTDGNYIMGDDEEEEVQLLTDVADLNFDDVPQSRDRGMSRGRSMSRSRSFRRSHSASASSRSFRRSFGSDEMQADQSPSSPLERSMSRGRSLSRHRMSSSGSVRSLTSRLSSFSGSFYKGSPQHQKSTTDLLREKAQLLVGDTVEVTLRPNGMHYVPALVEEIQANNTYKIRIVESNEIVEELPREQIRLPLQALEDQERVYPFAVGDRVQGNFRGTGEWISGVITKDRGYGVYDIDYIDGRLETKVSSDCIRRAVYWEEDGQMKYNLFDKVEVKSIDGGYWYPAKIHKVRKDERTYDVLYSDGQKDIHVLEHLIRPGRNETGDIPSIRPAFIPGDRVYVKSRSKAFGMEIRAFSELIHQSAEEIKELFGLMRSVEEEEAILEVKRNSAFTEIDLVDVMAREVEEYQQLNPGILLAMQQVDGAEKMIEEFAEGNQTLKDSRRVLADEDYPLMELLKELRAEFAKASLLVRQREAMNYDFLSHRSGLGDEELHALTVATAGLKVELEAIETAKTKAKRSINALSESRHHCVDEIGKSKATQKLGEDVLAHLRAAATVHPSSMTSLPTIPPPPPASSVVDEQPTTLGPAVSASISRTMSHPPAPRGVGRISSIATVSNGSDGNNRSHNLLGRFDSNRSIVDESAAVDFGDIYETDNAPPSANLLGVDPKYAADHVDDLLADIDRIDVEDDTFSGDERDELQEDQEEEPEPDLRRTTCLGALLLAFKDLRCESTDLSSDSGLLPTRRVVKSTRFTTSSRPPSTNLSLNQTLKAILAGLEGPVLQRMDEDEESYLPRDAASSLLCELLPIERSGEKAWTLSFAPRGEAPIAAAISQMPSPKASRRGSLAYQRGPLVVKGEDPRFTEAKRSLEEKKSRAWAARASCDKAREQWQQWQRQYKDLATDCAVMIRMNALEGIIENKMGEESRVVEKQIRKIQDVIAVDELEEKKVVDAAQAELSRAEAALADMFSGSSVAQHSLEERLNSLEDCKNAFVHAWSHWEEAKPVIDRLVNDYRDLFHAYRQKRDAIRHLHKISSFFDEYKKDRERLLLKDKEVVDLYQEAERKFKELGLLKDEVDSEAATWEWYNRRVSDIGRRPYRRSVMSMSSNNLAQAGGNQNDNNSPMAEGGSELTRPVSTRRMSMSAAMGGSAGSNGNSPMGSPAPNAVSRRNSFSASPAIAAAANAINTDMAFTSNPLAARRQSLSVTTSSPTAVEDQSPPATPSTLAININPIAINTNAIPAMGSSRPTTPRVQAERKSILVMQQKLTLPGGYFEQARQRAMEENKIDAAFQEYHTLSTLLMEEDYKVIKFEKRLFGSATYYATLNLSVRSMTASTYNLNAIVQEESSSVSLSTKCAEAAEEPSEPLPFTNDHIRLMSTNHNKLVFSLIQDGDQLYPLKENLDRAYESRVKLLQILRDLSASIQLATECCRQEQSAFFGAISSLNNDVDSIQTVKKMINAHRLHQKYQGMVKTLMHDLLQQQQSIEQVETMNHGKESAIQESRSHCKDLIQTIEKFKLSHLHLHLPSTTATNNDVLNMINHLLLQCEEAKLSVGNYLQLSKKNDDQLAGLDESLRTIALRRLEEDFRTNWEDDDYSTTASAPSTGFALALNTAANASPSLVSMGSGHNLLAAMVGANPSNPSSAAAASNMTSQFYEQYLKVNGLYEEEIEMLKKGIQLARQRWEYLSLVHHYLLTEYSLYQQIHVQKEYLMYHLIYAQFKDLDGEIESLMEGMDTKQHEIHTQYTTDKSEFTTIQCRWHELRDQVQSNHRLRHLLQHFPQKENSQSYQRLVESLEVCGHEVTEGLEEVMAPFVQRIEAGDLERLLTAYHRLREEYQSDITNALRAYESYDIDPPMLSTVSAGNGLGGLTSQNNSSYSLTALAASSPSRSLEPPRHTSRNHHHHHSAQEDYLYTIAALEQGTQAATQMVSKLQEILTALKDLNRAIPPILTCHQKIQSGFDRMYVDLKDLEGWIEKERVRKEYRTAWGKIFLGNEFQLIPNFHPLNLVQGNDVEKRSQNEEDLERMRSLAARLGGLEAIDRRLRDGLLSTWRETGATHASSAEDMQWINLHAPGSHRGDGLEVELNANPKEFLHLAKMIELTDPTAWKIMANRSNLKVIPKASQNKSLARTKTAQNVKTAVADNKLVPALVASIERKTSTKSILGGLMGDQSAWKYLNIKEPQAVDPNIASMTSFANEIKAIEDKLEESAPRVLETESKAEELAHTIEETMDRLMERHRGFGEDKGHSGEDDLDALINGGRRGRGDGDDALYQRVVMSEEELGGVLASFDSLLSNLKTRKVVIEDVEERSERRVEDELDVNITSISTRS